MLSNPRVLVQWQVTIGRRLTIFPSMHGLHAPQTHRRSCLAPISRPFGTRKVWLMGDWLEGVLEGRSTC